VVGEGECLRIADLEADPRSATVRLCKCHVGRRRIDPDDDARGGRCGNHAGERTRSRPDVQYSIAVADADELYEQRSKLAAPSAHEPIVRVAGREHHVHDGTV